MGDNLQRLGSLIAVGVIATIVAACSPSPPPVVPTAAVASPLPSPSAAAMSPSPGPAAAPSPSADEEAVDTEEAIDSRPPAPIPARIELYPLTVSILPGQPLQLAVSTPAPTYRLVVERIDATLPSGVQVVSRSRDRPGHDYRRLATFDTVTKTARANWPVTDTVPSKGWQPGVYLATARDSTGRRSQAIFVVRTPDLRADRPLFMFTALTYQAYNMWGGANLYSYAGVRAVRVSFARPYALDGGRGYWTRDDDRILRWLQLRRLPLQYSTDYDLALDPPPVAPRLLIIPRHAEYVPGSLRDWVEQHVEAAGDMNVLSFGANGFYWQVRLVPPPGGGPTRDVVCWKRSGMDPMAGVNPAKTTVRWRDAPLLRPEGALFGAQFSGVVGDGFTRADFIVTPDMPPELLAGTGWRTGTVLHGLLLGETDALFAGSGAISIMSGQAVDKSGHPLRSDVTIRQSPAGARVFDGSTFAWADGFPPAKARLGVSTASFGRFNRNLLAWLGFRVRS